MTLMCDSLFLGSKNVEVLHFYVVKSVVITHFFTVKSVVITHLFVAKSVYVLHFFTVKNVMKCYNKVKEGGLYVSFSYKKII